MHRCVVTLPKIADARTAYQAAKLIVGAGLSTQTIQQLAAALQFRPVALNTQRPLQPGVAAELIALGCEATETLEPLSTWLAQIAALRERYGVGPGLWKPVLLVAGIWVAQHLLLAAGPSADLVAGDVERHAAGRAIYEARQENQAEQLAQMQAKSDEARKKAEAAKAQAGAAVEATAAREPLPAAQASEAPPSGATVRYETRNPGKKCYFKARKGFSQVRVKAFNRCAMCRDRELVWEGTLSDGEESEDLAGKIVYGYHSEADGKELTMDGFFCSGPTDVPPFDPDLFPRKPEEQ